MLRRKTEQKKWFSSFLILMMVLSLLAPMSAFANEGNAAEETSAAPFKQSVQQEGRLQEKAAIAEQLNLLGGEARIHEELKRVSGNEQVSVIIHLSEKSPALENGIKGLKGKKMSSSEMNAVKQKVKSQQTLVKKQMVTKGIKFAEGYSFDTVLNGLSGKVKADDLQKLLEIEGITLIEPDAEVHALESKPAGKLEKPVQDTGTLKQKGNDMDVKMDTSISFLGIEKLWAEGYEGQGIKVAVLDTGIDADHPEFRGIYKGGKNFVPHTGTDYARPRADDDASETSPLDRPANRPEFNSNGSSFYTSHGTHVAGTIAAIGDNPYGIKGIAPKVDLYAYRVLGAYGSGSTSGIIKAIDTAVTEGMDVINLSLGGGSNSETDGASFAINNAMLAGTISVIATGNSGPNRGTIGTPATSRLGIGVGNTTNPEAHYRAQVNVTAGEFKLSKTVDLMASMFGVHPAEQLDGEYPIVAVPGAGKAEDYTGLDVNGKVALVSRGDIPFVEKIEYAKKNGAVAVLIHNFAGGSNAPGKSDVFLGDAFEFIPSFDVSQTDGEAIREAVKGQDGKVTFSAFEKSMTEGDAVNDSSSRGPSTPNFDIKPDVTAPGTNIMSTIPMYKADFPEATYEEAYTRKTGTSMATPHVAGIAALVKQANPSWSAFDVKVALSNTAKLLDTAKYDVFSQGAGRVQPYAAAHPDLLAYALDKADNDGQTVDNQKGTVTFGPQSLEKDLSVTKQIMVKSPSGKGGSYEATVQVTKSFGDAAVTVDKPSFTLSGEQILNVTLTASKAAAKSGDEILGYIHIKGNGSEISLPFAADFGGAAAAQIKDLKISESDLSFDGDGVKDEAMLTFRITGDVGTNFIELWNVMDPEGGVYGDGYIGYLHAASSLAAGSYQLAIKGQYFPWSGDPQTKIPDGLYTVDFTAESSSGVVSDYAGPVTVKSEAGTVEGDITGNTVRGKIDDLYVQYQQELEKYGLGYDLNTKLKAVYEVKEEEEIKASGPVQLAQDGSFSFELETLDKAKNSVIVKYEDAAGNKAEKVIYKAGDQKGPEYKVSDDKLSLKAGETAQLTVTETTVKPDGTTEEKDVTGEAKFETADAKVATVEGGKVTAEGAGKTEITVTYKEFKATVTVEVKAVDGGDQVTYSVSKTSLTLGVGQQEQLIVTETKVKPDGTVIEKDVTDTGKYNVVNNSIATIHKGLVTAKATGKTQARVMIPGQETILVYLEVKELPQDIVTYSVNKKELALGVGQQEQLIVTETTVKPDGTVIEKDVTGTGTYNVVNNKVATVKKGLVTALAPGKTQVRVMLPEQETIYVYLEVKELPQDIITYSVNKKELTLGVGQQEQLFVTETTVKPDGTVLEKDITGLGTYNVVDNTVATVKKGLVTAKTAGKTQVRANFSGQEPIYVYLEVKDLPQDIVTYEVNKKDLQLETGQQEQLKVTQVTMKPDGRILEKDVTAASKFGVVNPEVATVQRGLVTALKAGKTQVKVTAPEQEPIFVYLEVTGGAADKTTVSIDTESLALKVGEEARVIVTEATTKADGTKTERDVSGETVFTSGDEAVATATGGKVTAVKAGSTFITASYKDFTASIQLSVEEAAQDQVAYSVNKTDIALQAGGQDRLMVLETTEKADGSYTIRDVTEEASLYSADENVATVSGQGMVSAISTGTTEIHVLFGDFTAAVTVKVEEAAVPAPETNTHIVTAESIAPFLDNKKEKQIIIDVLDLEDEVNVELGLGVLDLIKESKKAFVIQKGGAIFTFEDGAVKELASKSGGEVTIAISKRDASNMAEAVSDLFTLEFYKGAGESKQLLDHYKKDIELIVPIDLSKVVKTNKLAVLDVNSNKTMKAKYKKDQLSFETEGSGSFVVVND